MASNNIFALNVALHNLATEGISSRMRRFRELALQLRAGLRQIGMLPFTPDEILAPILTGAYGLRYPTSKIIDYG
jgi:aspartate aminotransferase-like enzyme